MTLDASSELYILPLKPPDEKQCHSLCKTVNMPGLSSNDDLKDLLEIRITELPRDMDDTSMLHSKSIAGNIASDYGTILRHQEIDLESLNQILAKDVVYMSSSNPEDIKLSMGSEGTVFSEVKTLSSVPVIMFSKDQVEHKLVSHPQEYSSFDLKCGSRLKGDRDIADDFIVFNDEGNVLSSIQVFGVENLDQNMWIPEHCQESLPEVGLDTSNLLDPLPVSTHLVPVKLENDVVFIDAAPSGNITKIDKAVLPMPVMAETQSAERPSVFSVSVSNAGSQDVDQDSTLANKKSIGQSIQGNHHATPSFQLPSTQKVQSTVSAQHNIVATHSRSVLKTSFTKGGTKHVPIKPKMSGKQYLKEEHFSSLINQSAKPLNQNSQLLRKTKYAKGNCRQSQSLAVVAISSDKTKDLTEIFVSTAKGEQMFKGKTSEIISATPNLWSTNSVKSTDEAVDCNDTNTPEEEDFMEDQLMTDALQRLGVPTLSWVQNKPKDQRMWYCPEKGCKKLFPLLNQLKVHILGHYGVRPYKCDFPNCQWAFYTHFKLKRHKETHLQRKDFKCSVPECGRSFTTIYNLKTHQKLHKRPAEIICPVSNCSELFQTRRSLEFHLKEHGSDHAPYVCPYSSCQKRYYSVNSVNSHIRSHQHKDDEIRCQWSGCSKVFTKPCRLRAHMRTHTGDKPYLCTHPGCTWAFTSSSKLRRHQFKHTNVRNFQCHIDGCGKLFMRSEHLKEHALTHSAERTFQCPHPNCNMKFSAKSSLYVHSKKHRAKVHAVPTESADAVTSIPVKVIQSTGKIGVQNVATTTLCTIQELNIDNQIAIQGVPPENSVQSDLPEATQTLDFIPLLTEDEALVAELANVEPVSFEHNSTTQLRSTDASLPLPVMESSSSVLSSLPEYLEDSRTPHISQVLLCSQGSNESANIQGQDEDIGKVLNPGSARSSITIHSWAKFKKVRQSQALPMRNQRQPRRQSHQIQKYRKQVNDTSEMDQTTLTAEKQISQEGLSNLRAPLDVVLGSGYLGSGHDSIAHLLMPDDLTTSSDLYSSEDGILNMESSFVPSTINLRDLE